ncbi:arginine decarboxylase [Streptomyces ziwulingensis]|uniref:Orn/Lys/Arg decarboxylase N-terminal domain-containing protein n=1 Tax=Streptomyces ziwulingensis TaxID=1045501 RepID=A0ABP9CAQ8_9ACTN
MEQRVILVDGAAGPGETRKLWMRDLAAHLERAGLGVTGRHREPRPAEGAGAVAVVVGAAALPPPDLPDDPAGRSSRGQRDGEVLRLPVFIVLDGAAADQVRVPAHWPAAEFLDPRTESPGEVAARIVRRAREPRPHEVPPLFAALRSFGRSDTQAWHTPTHSGGLAFTKSPAGRAFRAFYGEDLLSTDISVSVTELGSLLAHEGLIGAAEDEAARVFGADLSYFVLNGASTADRIVAHYALLPGSVALVDRNCHRALAHALVLTGAEAVPLLPSRNGYGLIGPVPPGTLAQAAAPSAGPAALAVLTNSTYDGICYDTVRASELLAARTPRILFDEAWLAYAHFHPLFRRRYAMAVDEEAMPGPERPTVFSVQSTHKMLTALSQGAMLHTRSAARAPVDRAVLDETYEMHGSTSPLYPLMASLDVSTATMRDHGRALIDEALREAIAFRQAVARRARQSRTRAGGDWFFEVWQPPQVTDPADGFAHAFQDAPGALLRTEPSCWLLNPEDTWHGFTGLEPGFCMLDPLKVTLLCPGITPGGGPTSQGIPAAVVSAYLQTRGITPEKSNDYTLQVLFSMGSSTAKRQALLDCLSDFKALYDDDAPLAAALPDLAADAGSDPATLRQLCADLHDLLTRSGHSRLLEETYTRLPRKDLSPQAAFHHLRAHGCEQVPLREAAGRTVATVVTLTPTAIPLFLPGENTGPPGNPHLRYLDALQARDRAFPRFRQEMHGVRRDPRTGQYHLMCLSGQPG